MENVVNVTDYLRRQIAKEGGDPERGTMQALPTVDGKYYFNVLPFPVSYVCSSHTVLFCPSVSGDSRFLLPQNIRGRKVLF